MKNSRRRGRRAVTALLLASLVSSTERATGQEVDGMGSFADVVSLRTVGQIAVSPDGATVAYTVRSTDWDENRYDTEIWVAGSAAPFQLTRTAEGSSGSPQWSPDGEWIAFTADRGDGNQVHVVSPRGGEAFPVTDVEGGVAGFRWSPDGTRMGLLVQEPESPEDKARSEAYGAYAVEDAEYRMSHLWLVDVAMDGEPGESSRLTEGSFTVSGFRWSPDGDEIAYVRHPSPDISEMFMGSDIWVAEVSSGRSRPLVTDAGPDGSPVWSPDGGWILFQEYVGDMDAVFYRNQELARIPSGGGPVELLTSGFDEQPGGAVWTERGIVFAASDGTRRQLYSLDPETGATTELTADQHAVGAFDLTPDGRTLAYTAQGGDQLSELYRVEGFTQRGPLAAAERLTAMTDQVAGWRVGTREVIQWQSEDGATIEGVLSKPDGFDPSRRYPLLVVIHGGPTGTSRPTMVPSYVYPIAHWVAKGAVVLEPNYRGSAGYGEGFRSLNVRNLGVGDMWDVMSGVESLVSEGVADPDLMGAMGWSQGGYISAFLTTNTDRFQAISVGAGISNWMTYYVNTDIHPFTRQYLKGTPWDDPDVYAKTSPMTSITQAKTPTLIQHGEFDRRVPIPNAYELYQGLQDQGVDTRLIVYKGFGHGISKPKELLGAIWHNWQWFGQYVWGEEIDLPIDVQEPGVS